MSMSRTLCMASVGVGLLLAAGPVSAHHAFSAEFDGNHPVKLDGAITKVELINPHAWIHMTVKKTDGTVEEWMVEGGTPNTLMRRGITRDSLKVGTVIHVDGYQAKDGSNRAVGKEITYTDGKRLFLGGSAPGAQGDAPDEKK